MRQVLRAVWLLIAFSSCATACSAGPTPPADACADACDAGRHDFDASDVATDVADARSSCTAATCPGAGSSCRAGACVEDCRPADAHACAAGTVCDFADGRCRAAGGPCVFTGTFRPCPGPGRENLRCGPGLTCDGDGSCVSELGCSGLDCDDTGRCWARSCPCDRPAPRCSAPALVDLNRPEFVGALSNGRTDEGIFDLEFDDICTAYAVTVISGTDHLRQLRPDGTLTDWPSVSNLDMGEVAVLRLPGGEFGTSLGEVAATYICNAGCSATSKDARLGVIRLDRTSTTRPLPNVLPAMSTSGTGPFGNTVVDSGPYGLTWGRDQTLYVGNVDTNGDYVRVDLASGSSSRIAMFPARVVAATVYDRTKLLIATEGGLVYLLNTTGGMPTLWAGLPGDATSLQVDAFSGRVYAEVRTSPPQILELRADGSGMIVFQTPPRLGRIAIAPDNFLYHASVYPEVNWRDGNAIVRFALPAQR